MPLNILNREIYYYLWFWYIILFVITLSWLVYRMLTICCPAVRRCETTVLSRILSHLFAQPESNLLL